MHPFNPRLLRYARSVRDPIAMTTLLGTLTTLLALARAFLISAALSPVVSDTASLTGVWPFIVRVAAVFACRALIVAAREAVSIRAAAATVRELRGYVVNVTITLGSRWRATKGAETTTLLSIGLEDLRSYFVSFLPRLVLVCTVIPAALSVILLLDFWSALITLPIIPLIPIFMILIGHFTQAASEDGLVSMKHLTAQLLNLISGLPTLRGLGHEKAPRTYLHALSATNTKTAMATLRVVFLSGGVLEFLTTLSVALVAVEVGMRLVFGNISLFRGLVVIILAPEVFDPLRQVGAQFHASANGVMASKATFDTIEETGTMDSPGADECPDMARTDIILDDLGVRARGAWAPIPTSGVITPGIVTVLCGPSNVGKSTIVLCLLASMTPDAGRVLLRPSVSSFGGGESVLLDIDPTTWRHQISWAPQSSTLVPSTILDSMDDLSLDDLNDATVATGSDDVLASTPDGWNTVIGSGGVGLSVRWHQCLALTRTLAVHSRVVILDELTAHLGAVSEEAVMRTIDTMQDAGRTVIIIAHCAAVMETADAAIDVRPTANEKAHA